MILKVKNNIKKKVKNIKSNFIKFKDNVIVFFKEKNKGKKIMMAIKKIWQYLVKNEIYRILILAFPFILMDLLTRIFSSEISFYSITSISPRLFSLAYMILFIGIIINSKKKYSKIIYSVIFALFFILFMVQNVYYSTMHNFFGFSLLSLASEGSSYLLDTIKKCNILVYIVALFILATFIVAIKMFPKRVSYNRKKIAWISVIFLILHIIAKMALGSANFELTWDTWRNPRNVYNNFNDSNKCMALAGLYEYTLRDFYITYIKPTPKKSETENKFLMDAFSNNSDSSYKNKYTGKFKNKNVIFIQMEGIDSWLFNKENMPTTYKLLDNSINFTNHYSFYNGGGSTFNSEFCVNTGYTSPFTYPTNAYSMNKNTFPYTLANLMNQQNYSVKAFHMNNREYYNRGINYSNWGYEQYYGLEDTGDYNNTDYYLDRELILNEKFNEKLFPTTEHFVDYIITYSNHVPFSSNSGVCRQLLELDYADKIAKMTQSEKNDFFNNLNMDEESCMKRQVKETDYMVELLLMSLKEKGLYDNTVIVFFTDHYLFTASDELLAKYKDKSNNLINHTPFFIWSADMKKEEVKKVTTQLNILPTMLNLLGISYNEKWYVMTDALDSKYKPLAIFSDMSWYDGTHYVVDGIIANSKKISEMELEEKNNLVEYLIKKNDLVLKYNYFNEIMSEGKI